MKNVLFVCTGNTCRSAMAKGIFEAAVAKDKDLSHIYSAESAGLAVSGQEPASTHATSVVKDLWGVDISRHRSKSLTDTQVNNADLILAMTRGHKDAILLQFPWLKSKVFTLKGYITFWEENITMEEYNYTLDITDPYGMPEEMYRRCALEIKNSVDRLLVILKTKEYSGEEYS